MQFNKEQVLRIQENKFAPEIMKDKKKVKTDELPPVFTVTQIVISKFDQRDLKTGEIKKSEKTGEPFKGFRAYVLVNDEMYFTSTSRILIDQLITEQQKKEFPMGHTQLEIEPIENLSIGAEMVTYKNNEKYPNIYLCHANE